MLALEIEASKPPRNDLKVVSVIEMTLLYGARYSCVLPRLEHEVKLLPHSAEKRVCRWKWAFENLGMFFLPKEKASDDRTFRS